MEISGQLFSGFVVIFGSITVIAAPIFHASGKETLAVAIPFGFLVLIGFLVTLLF